jgi:hypothetical protein
MLVIFLLSFFKNKSKPTTCKLNWSKPKLTIKKSEGNVGQTFFFNFFYKKYCFVECKVVLCNLFMRNFSTISLNLDKRINIETS